MTAPLPTLPVVAWRRFSQFTGWYFWGDEQAEPGSPDAQDLTPHAPAEAAIVALRAEVAELRKDADRLDWLDANHSSVSFAQGYLGKPASWGTFNIQTAAWATGFDNVRAAIDAARASLLGDAGDAQ